MTNQEAFDKAAAHLLRQNEWSNNNGDLPCMYRSPSGLKCAVGALIPDDNYGAYMEGASVRMLRQDDAIPFLAYVDIELLASLQRVHDQNVPQHWPKLLREVASNHELSSAIVDKTLAELEAQQ